MDLVKRLPGFAPWPALQLDYRVKRLADFPAISLDSSLRIGL